MSYPSGKRFRTDYDALGRLVAQHQVSDAGSILKTYVSNVTYNVAGQATGLTNGNNLTEQYTYSPDRLQLTNLKVLNGATALMDFSYNYTGAAGDHGAGTTAGNAGQLISMTGTLNGASRNQSFRYDGLGRLVSATGAQTGSAWQQRFEYDRWGNRSQVWDAVTGGMQLQQVNLETSGAAPTNRVSSYWDSATTAGATRTVTYDAGGNVTSDGSWTFTYDGENRIVQVNTASTGALIATYAYDSANRRIQKTVNTVTTNSVWEGAQVIAEYSESAGSPGGTRFYHQDRLSIRETTNSSGQAAGTQSHLPFGEQLTETGEQQKQKFTTYERDAETGDDYAINRGYWPTLGRFRQADAILSTGPNPQSLNRYAYVRSNPVNLIDPFGLDCIPLPDGTLDCTSDPPIRLEGTGHNSGFSGFGSSPCTEIYIDGFYAGSTCGGLQPFADGGNPGVTGRVGKPRSLINLKKLKDCLDKLFGVTLQSFVASQRGKNGSFNGVGPDTIRNGGNNASITVLNDVNAYTSNNLAAIAQLPPRSGVMGLTSGNTPYRNFTASDLRNSTAILATQVHELGNSLQNITGVTMVPNSPPGLGHDTDPGTRLERCVFGGEYDQQGRRHVIR